MLFLKINGVITSRTSYGIATTNIIDALENDGVHISTIPIGGTADWLTYQNIKPSLDRGQFFDLNNPCIRLYHEFDLAPRYTKGEHIGFPIFEKSVLTKQEIHQFLSCDRIFVCTEWAKSILEKNNINRPIQIVNLGIDGRIFYPEEPKDGPFTFFFPGKFEIRKGFDVVLEIFENAFNLNDDIKIVFLPFNHCIGQDNENWVKYLMSSKLANKIEVISRVEDVNQVADIYRRSDCVVSFSRAEGWNLPLLEGLACSKPVVATNYSAHTEFLNKDNATLVEIDELEPALDGVFFTNPDNLWAKLNDRVKKELTEALREVYKKGKVSNPNGVTTAQKFSWKNSANQIINNLKGIA